ncbi:hotdog fold domain-containing protein [Tamilnaduibacter salinus]|nr:hotdog fold domain-containing protein [Tamilnaduibacter salinus]
MDPVKTFQTMSSQPLGKFLFSKMVCQVAPYFASISPRIETLEPQRCVVTMKKRRRVTNHFKTVHAIAMCNMAELAGGMMTDASIPQGARWIPSGMSVTYLKKAKTDLTATADGSQVDWSREGPTQVPVSITDTTGEEVFHAQIEMNVKHR